MAKLLQVTLTITIIKSDRKLTLMETTGAATTVLMEASIVSGCEDSGTPSGTYKGGKWIKDKTNPTHGPKPWSEDQWGNPYGPYFLPLNHSKTGGYTTYGIHGTRGWLFGNLERPPVPEKILHFFFEEKDSAKYLYCSHGCVRLSNQNIVNLHRLATQIKYAGLVLNVLIK